MTCVPFRPPVDVSPVAVKRAAGAITDHPKTAPSKTRTAVYNSFQQTELSLMVRCGCAELSRFESTIKYDQRREHKSKTGKTRNTKVVLTYLKERLTSSLAGSLEGMSPSRRRLRKSPRSLDFASFTSCAACHKFECCRRGQTTVFGVAHA